MGFQTKLFSQSFPHSYLYSFVPSSSSNPGFDFWVPVQGKNGSTMSGELLLHTVWAAHVPQLHIAALRDRTEVNAVVRVELQVPHTLCITVDWKGKQK